MKYINDTTDEMAECSYGEKIKLVHNNVKKIRQSEKMGVKYMQLWEEIAYVREEGREEGREETLKALIEVCKELGLSRDDTFIKIKDKCGFKTEDAEKYFTRFWGN